MHDRRRILYTKEARSTSEEEQDIWTEGEESVGTWHDQPCHLPYPYHFRGVTTCLNCCAIDADPVAYDMAHGIFNL